MVVYIAERNRTAATTFSKHAEHAIEMLGEFPNMAQEANEAGVRMKPIRHYPYLIFYTIEADELVVLHIRHGARRWPWEEESET